ncbi:hypothetical protein L3X38_002666 [Prunus dulcis]|uniref:Uncharacterized protein n=1 Tax=Prunus dulcis TaxID=3755 RepID=A0AAD4ZK79_PRUDU|nr:hypothetical protein L3X38_002666 [Prunus dulcis]
MILSSLGWADAPPQGFVPGPGYILTSAQKASRYEDARVVTHPGIAPASNSLNFGVPTNPKPVSSQKASYYIDARVVTHPGIAPASNSLNFGVLTNPKPVSSQKASYYIDSSELPKGLAKVRVAQRTTQTLPSMILSSLGWADAPPQGFVPGPGYILTSAQKASRYEDARVVTHPGIAPASNSLNFGVPTNPKPVSSQKASYYIDARVALIPNCHTPDRLRRSRILSALGLAIFSQARTVLFLGAHEATSQDG